MYGGFATHALIDSSFVTYAGNYKLGGCPPEAGNIIQQTINFLKPILFEPQFINPPAYQAFLGGVNPRIVQDIFTQVAGASEITVDGVVKRPEIWCISPQDMQNPLDETAKHCTAGGIVTYFDWIALCPIFFTFPLRGGVCAQVDAARTAMVSSFRQDQYSTLLVGLTYIYLSQKYREQTYALMQSEKNDLNTHISAKPKDKLISPWNYAYYAESKEPLGHESASFLT